MGGADIGAIVTPAERPNSDNRQLAPQRSNTSLFDTRWAAINNLSLPGMVAHPTVSLETQRLVLLPLRLEDAEQIQVKFAKWEVVRLLSATIPWPYPYDGARRWCKDFALPEMARGEAWHWTLRLKSSPAEIIGAIGLMTHPNDNRGFWLSPEWHRQGLMSEAVEAATDFWFNVLKFDVLRAPKAAANIGSRRISEKTGMRRIAVQESDHVSGRLVQELWEITAEEWARRREEQESRSE